MNNILTRKLDAHVARIDVNGTPAAWVYPRRLDNEGGGQTIHLVQVFNESLTPDGRPILGVYSSTTRALAEAVEFFRELEL